MILFAAIDVPISIAKDLARVQRGVSGAKWRTPQQLHITLGYFGELCDERAEDLDLELARIARGGFELSLSGGGHFGHDAPHAIWTGVNPSEDLITLQNKVSSAARRCGAPLDGRKFKPHVTLAYFRAEVLIERVIAWERMMAKFKTRPFWVDQFALYSSNPKKRGGNLYVQEATYPLLG